jgi:transcription elongation factor GreA
MSDVIYVTGEGLIKLKEELEQLRNFERPSISRQIAEARDKGDLSENAEYAAAKEAQGMLESEANFKLGKIAVSSPIAQGLIGKKVGDVVSIKVPSGIIPFEIISISM